MKFLVQLASAMLFGALCPNLVSAAPAGTLDPTFGVGGKRTVQMLQSLQMLYQAMVRDSAGRIYLMNSRSEELVIARLHHDGSLDFSYGVNGIVSIPLNDSAILTAAAMQRDGYIVLGFSASSIPGLRSCRIRFDGTFDASFGAPATPGCSHIGSGNVDVNAIVVQTDGRIVLAGTQSNQLDRRGVVARVERDGTPDATFSDDGVVLLEPGVKTAFNDVALAPNGDIVVAGYLRQSDADFLLLRLSGADGAPVTSFGAWGAAVVAFDAGAGDYDLAFAVSVLPDGGIVAAGYAHTADAEGGFGKPAVVKLTGSGAPDESFGTGGKRIYYPCVGIAGGCYTISADDLVTLPGERIVLAGSFMPQSSANSDFFAMRLGADGEPDPEFGNVAAVPGTSIIPFDLGGTLDDNSPEKDNARFVAMEGERVLLAGSADVATGDPDDDSREDFAIVRLDHGLPHVFSATPKPGLGGTLLPDTVQLIGHSDRAEFVVLPKPGYVFHRIEKGPGYCEGGMDGEVFVTAPMMASCEARVSFKLATLFADEFE